MKRQEARRAKIAVARAIIKQIKDTKAQEKSCLTKEDIISFFRRFRPRSVKELRAMGLKAIVVGSGLFRDAVRVEGVVIAKFPKRLDGGWDNDGEGCVEHIIDELNAVRLIQKEEKYKPLRRFLPEFYFIDRKNAVVLMPEYKRIRSSNQACWASEFISNLAFDLGFSNTDLHEHNVMKHREDIVIVDLGFFGSNEH